MLYPAYVIALWVFAAAGEYRLRGGGRVPDRWRYRRFVFACAVGFAAVPLVMGDWLWSIALLPFAVAAMEIRLRLVLRSAQPSVPKPPAA